METAFTTSIIETIGKDGKKSHTIASVLREPQESVEFDKMVFAKDIEVKEIENPVAKISMEGSKPKLILLSNSTVRVNLEKPELLKEGILIEKIKRKKVQIPDEFSDVKIPEGKLHFSEYYKQASLRKSETLREILRSKEVKT